MAGFSSWRKWPAPVTGSWRRKKVIWRSRSGSPSGALPQRAMNRLLVGRLQKGAKVLGEVAVVGELTGGDLRVAGHHALLDVLADIRFGIFAEEAVEEDAGRLHGSPRRGVGRRDRPSRLGRRNRGEGRP